MATNLAVGLARTAPHSTVLVDLDVQFGDVASALDLDPEYSLPDAVHGPASQDTMVLKTFLTLHETGLYVICGPRTPADADGIAGQDVSRLLQMLASEFRYVVVDTAPGLSEHTLAALDQTTDLVLLTSMDVPGVRGLRKELDALTQLDLLTDSRHVVLNFADTRAGLSVADVEATIGTARRPRAAAVEGSPGVGQPGPAAAAERRAGPDGQAAAPPGEPVQPGSVAQAKAPAQGQAQARCAPATSPSRLQLRLPRGASSRAPRRLLPNPAADPPWGQGRCS